MPAECSADLTAERAAAAREPQSLPTRRLCGCQRLGYFDPGAALVSCRGCEVLDDRIAGMPHLGGVQFRSREPQLVDNADEGTRSHGGPDAQDSHADDSTSGLGDDDRRGRDIEQIAQEVGVRRPVAPIGAIMSHKADGGVEIGRSGAADVNLHEGPQRGNGRATRSERCWTTLRRIPRFGVEPADLMADSIACRGSRAALSCARPTIYDPRNCRPNVVAESRWSTPIDGSRITEAG